MRLLTIREIAKGLGVAESNLRYYRDHIGDFLPSKGRGKKKRYTEEAIGIFRRVVEMVREGETLDSIYVQLANEKPATRITLPESQLQQSGGIAEILRDIKENMVIPSSAIEMERRNAELESREGFLQNELLTLNKKLGNFIVENEEKNKLLISLRIEKEHLIKRLKESEFEMASNNNEISRLKEEIEKKEGIIGKQNGVLVETGNFQEMLTREFRALQSQINNLMQFLRVGNVLPLSTQAQAEGINLKRQSL